MTGPRTLALAAAALLVLLAAWQRRRGAPVWPPLAGAVLALAYAAVPPGVLPSFEEVIAELADRLGRGTYVLVGVLAFLETAAFVGLLAPGEFTVVLGGAIAGRGDIDVRMLALVTWAAAAGGDSAGFWLGRRLGREFLEAVAPRLGLPASTVTSLEAYFDRHGAATVLLGRWIGVARAVAPFLAGASDLSYRRFVPWSIVGSGAWAVTFVTLGYVFWQSSGEVVDRAGQAGVVVGTLVVVVVGVRLLLARRRRAAAPVPARAGTAEEGREL